MTDDEARVRARLRDYVGSVVPISDIAAAGRARYRQRVRRRRATAVLGGVLVVVGASGLGVALARRPTHAGQFRTGGGASSIGTPASSPITTVVGSRRRIVDTSWISDDTGWALTGSAILGTTDGGRSWKYVASKPSTPARYGTPCRSVCVTRIRFADARHGWLFGSDFFETDDGGKTWTRAPSDPVVALEAAHGRVYRLVSEGVGCPGPCDYQLQTEAVGGGPWLLVRTPDIGPGGVAQLLYDGPRIYVAAYMGTSSGVRAPLRLIRTIDGARSWSTDADPCGSHTTDAQAVALAAVPGGGLIVVCERPDLTAAFIRISTDAGATFGPPRALPSGGGPVAAGSLDSIVVVGTSGAHDASYVVDVSHDAGRTWRRTLSARVPQGEASVAFLGFEDARTGRVAFSGDRLWTTRDGGDTWSASRP